LPFCHLTLNVERSDSYEKLADCETLGDHLKRRRLMLGLRQIDVAPILGVDSFTLANWEKGATHPAVRCYPAIMDFLGYCPFQQTLTFGDRLRLHRTHRGLSHRDLARLAGVDPASISRWETGDRRPWKHLLDRLRVALGMI
jgi:transcriptional regulator with XRE-family HTH domain